MQTVSEKLKEMQKVLRPHSPLHMDDSPKNFLQTPPTWPTFPYATHI